MPCLDAWSCPGSYVQLSNTNPMYTMYSNVMEQAGPNAAPNYVACSAGSASSQFCDSFCEWWLLKPTPFEWPKHLAPAFRKSMILCPLVSCKTLATSVRMAVSLPCKAATLCGRVNEQEWHKQWLHWLHLQSTAKHCKAPQVQGSPRSAQLAWHATHREVNYQMLTERSSLTVPLISFLDTN